jgi:hypothetical protein
VYNSFDLIVISAIFSNISAISWRPVVVVEEAEVPGDNHRPVVNQKLNHLYYIDFRQRSSRLKYNQRVNSYNNDYIHCYHGDQL